MGLGSPMGPGWRCTRAPAPCGGASWRARKPSSPITKWGMPAVARILHPPCMCRRSSSTRARRWLWPPAPSSLSSTVRSMRWPWPGHLTTRPWGTPKVADVLEAAAWPRVSRERNERQEHRFKRLIDPGALTTNDGRKQLVGPDRHQQRARAQREQSLESARKRVDKKAEAVQMKQAHMAESEAQGHGKRLEQRQRAVAELAKAWQNAQDPHDQLTEQTNALRPPGERADRDVRTQTIMTVRTLRLENALRAFMVVLGARLQTQVRRDGLIRLLFERSGARMETDSQVVDWVNTAGFSVAYQRLLKELVEGLCAIDLQDQGKPICVRLKD